MLAIIVNFVILFPSVNSSVSPHVSGFLIKNVNFESWTWILLICITSGNFVNFYHEREFWLIVNFVIFITSVNSWILPFVSGFLIKTWISWFWSRSEFREFRIMNVNFDNFYHEREFCILITNGKFWPWLWTSWFWDFIVFNIPVREKN